MGYVNVAILEGSSASDIKFLATEVRFVQLPSNIPKSFLLTAIDMASKMSSKKINAIEPLKRSRSLCSLSDNLPSDVTVRRRDYSGYRENQSRTISDSSMEITAVSDSDHEERVKQDSGVCDKTFDGELHVLEQKIDRLSDMFLEQCRLLTTMKEEIRNSRAIVEKAEFEQNEIIGELVQKAISQSNAAPEIESENSRAKCLLDAIESSRGSVDSEIRDVLVSFLQSEELKERMVQATAESVKDVITSCLSRDVSALYLPILEHSHRRLLRHVARVVEEAFKELEEYSSCLSKSVYKISKSLNRAIERHRSLLEAAADPQKNLVSTLRCTVEELLSKELKQWRQKVLDTFAALQEPAEELPEPPNLDYAPTSQPQPADPERNIIDQLMIAVEISKQIEQGEVNNAFERALSASDLSLVMTACRAARGSVFAPHCRLHQHVLLALLQQLSTDMLHDTQLKCRYLEDAIINLDPTNPATRSHLPLVVGEVRKHLSKFLASYPSHVAGKRVSMIIMAADNLMK